MSLDANRTAVIFVGFQNDYFATNGILRGVVEEPDAVDRVLANAVNLIRAVHDTPLTLISTPIVLAPDYRAMAHPVGILNAMKEYGAFKEGSVGAETIPEFRAFGDRVEYVHGKVGFNAFAGTDLGTLLKSRGIDTALVCGMVTSLCIDSTGRAAYERGMEVGILRDCTSARTLSEHEFYCANIFPLYGRVLTSTEAIAELTPQAA